MSNLIGNAPHQVPTNADLGSMAFQDANYVTVNKITAGGVSSTVASITGATGTVAHDYTEYATWYHTGIAASFTANFTNVPTTNNRVTEVTLILAQGGTPYIPSAVQIDGSAQTIKWLNASIPTGTASRVEAVTFSLVRTNAVWTVLGELKSFG